MVTGASMREVSAVPTIAGAIATYVSSFEEGGRLVSLSVEQIGIGEAGEACACVERCS